MTACRTRTRTDKSEHMTWRKHVEPEATAWRTIEHELGAGLVHGQRAVDLVCVRGVNRSPADAAALLAAMVEADVLAPCRPDPASASPSVKAFRTAGPSAGQHDPVSPWAPAIAHLWAYTAGGAHAPV